jgi:short-subunit dehydrogenase
MLQERVVLITGASSGIGAALARVYGSHGSRVVLAARRLSRIQELASEVERGKGEALAVACDVTQDGDVKRVVEQAVERWGRLDTLIANAGFGVTGNVENLSLDDYRRQFETNVFGLIRTIKAGLPQILEQRGRIALIGSVAGFIASPGGSPYCMSKFAVRALAQSLRLELKPQGVSVTHIAPGFVDSEIRLKKNDETLPPGAKDPVPSWLVMNTDKAARQIFEAIEKRRRQRIVTGHGKLIVFLARHAPWLLEAGAGHRQGLSRSSN